MTVKISDALMSKLFEELNDAEQAVYESDEEYQVSRLLYLLRANQYTALRNYLENHHPTIELPPRKEILDFSPKKSKRVYRKGVIGG